MKIEVLVRTRSDSGKLSDLHRFNDVVQAIDVFDGISDDIDIDEAFEIMSDLSQDDPEEIDEVAKTVLRFEPYPDKK